MAWHSVAQIEDVKPGRATIVNVKGKEIGLFCEKGRYYAVLNYCPHRGAPMCLGRISGAVTATGVGEQDYDHSRVILRCPWHHWEFDLETGAALVPVGQRIKTYPLRVDDEPGQIEDCIEHANAPGEGDATTFNVRAASGRIWIDI